MTSDGRAESSANEKIDAATDQDPANGKELVHLNCCRVFVDLELL
jgi:hypothetical protein